MLKPSQVIATVQQLLQVKAFEADRLEALARVVSPSQQWQKGDTGHSWQLSNITQVPVPTDATEPQVRQAARSETNMLPLVLDTFSQVMKVDNYLSGDKDAKESPSAWSWWQRNQMDARQTGLHRAALHYGAAYNTILPAMIPGKKVDSSAVHWYPSSPRQMTAVYGERMVWNPKDGGPVDDDWPMLGLEVNGNMIRLYDEKNVYFVGVLQQPHSVFGWKDPNYLQASNFKYIETRNHGVGVCPIVRYRDRVLLDGEEQFGIIEPLLTVQSRINETTYALLGAQYVAAFKQKYITGWLPKEEGAALKMKVNNVWVFNDKEVKVGELNETDLSRIIQSKESAVTDLSAQAQLPPHALGLSSISNISETTLAALETAKERKSDEITTSLGESHEQAFRLSAYISGDTDGAEDFQSEVKWRDQTARAYAATIDALGKLGSMLNVPDEIVWEDIPGWTRSKVDRAKALREEADPLGSLFGIPESQVDEPANPTA